MNQELLTTTKNGIVEYKYRRLAYNNKTMVQGQVINFGDWSKRLTDETNLQIYLFYYYFFLAFKKQYVDMSFWCSLSIGGQMIGSKSLSAAAQTMCPWVFHVDLVIFAVVLDMINQWYDSNLPSFIWCVRWLLLLSIVRENILIYLLVWLNMNMLHGMTKLSLVWEIVVEGNYECYYNQVSDQMLIFFVPNLMF